MAIGLLMTHCGKRGGGGGDKGRERRTERGRERGREREGGREEEGEEESTECGWCLGHPYSYLACIHVCIYQADMHVYTLVRQFPYCTRDGALTST